MNHLSNIIIEEATSRAQLAVVRELFLEYAASLEISLCFQNFEEELAALPGKYAPPIAAAREIGFDRMKLDTLASMTAAIALYRSLGFQRIPPYYDNPSESAVFMELHLNSIVP